MLDVHCPACLQLGYSVPRFLFSIEGVMCIPETVVQLRFNCAHCKSVVKWSYGTNEFEIIKLGQPNYRQQKAVFE